jgi:serine phosphatase RsbU (regulator of sigma subunit)
MPRNRINRRTTTHRNWNAQPSSSTSLGLPAAPNAPLADEMDSLLREKLDLHAQLFEAAQIQRKLSGPRVLRHDDVQFASEVFAARYLSGDFTIISQHGAKVLTTLGDIAGKGFAAGMWFTNLAGLLQSYAHPHSDPGRTASEINRHLCYLRPVAPFVTAFIAQMDCDRGELTYCNAGHFPPILLRADGRAELLQQGGPLLGALENAGYESGRVTFDPGDVLVAYSDGVLECRNRSEEEFGSSRLLNAVHEAKQQTAQATLVALLAAVQDFANGSPLCDDVSLIVVQRDSNWRSS